MSCDLQAIVQAISQRVDSAAGCVMRTVFNLISNHDNGPTSSSQPYSPEVRVQLVLQCGLASSEPLQYFFALISHYSSIGVCLSGV